MAGARRPVNTYGAPETWKEAPIIWAWPYLSADGAELYGVVARYESDVKRKSVVPFFKRDKDGWIKGGPYEPYPLFGLNTLSRPGDVYIAEGERAAAALQYLGLPGITSQGGSSAASKSDWSPLSGRKVYILPDNDETGEHYAADVEKTLAELKNPPTVHRLYLPGLPEKGDMVDWIQARVPEWDGYQSLPQQGLVLGSDFLRVVNGIEA